MLWSEKVVTNYPFPSKHKKKTFKRDSIILGTSDDIFLDIYEIGLFQKLNEINLSNSKSWWHTCITLMNKKPVINSPLSINGELISDNLKKLTYLTITS